MTDARRTGCAALLAGLADVWPRTLAAVLDASPPEQVWARAVAGQPLHGAVSGAAAAKLVAAARARAGADPLEEAARHDAAGVRVLLRDDPAYPSALLADIAPPAVLFAQGDLAVLDAPRVAIVGTRRCTGAGAGVARGLARDLAGAGVAVVSGLAQGIDGAAHRGVLDALERPDPPPVGAPIGVIGCGHDLPYPARHRDLWAQVAARGVLLGEAPMGTRPTAWRFPSRNRVIAALADVVVVVESHAAGGSLLTVREAMHRGIDVMAVPGAVRNPAAAGTNQLLADGCHPVRDADDVLVALGMLPGGRRTAVDRRATPDADGQVVLEAFDWEPATLEHLALRTGRPVPQLALALHRLEADGWITGPGPWYERVGAE